MESTIFMIILIHTQSLNVFFNFDEFATREATLTKSDNNLGYVIFEEFR